MTSDGSIADIDLSERDCFSTPPDEKEEGMHCFSIRVEHQRDANSSRVIALAEATQKYYQSGMQVELERVNISRAD